MWFRRAGWIQLTTATVSQRYVYISFCVKTHLQQAGPRQITVPNTLQGCLRNQFASSRLRDFWPPRRCPGAATPWGLSGNQSSSAKLLREGLSPRLREKGKCQQLSLAVPQNSNRAKGKEEDFTAHPSTQGHACTRRSQQTERFFARCFFTTNDGIKVFRRGRHAGLSGKSLDPILWKRQGGLR